MSHIQAPGLPTLDLTAELPGRFRMVIILYPTALVVTTLFVLFSLGSSWFSILAWSWAIYCGVLTLIAMFVAWQALSYRNPILRLAEEGMLYYGTRIPWGAIRSTYVGTSNFYMIAEGHEGAVLPQDRVWIGIENRELLQLTAPSRRFMYSLARVLLRRSGGKLLLPLVKECSVNELALAIQERIAGTT